MYFIWKILSFEIYYYYLENVDFLNILSILKHFELFENKQEEKN